MAGGKWATTVANLMKAMGCKTALDYGAGKGVLASKLRTARLDIREYDPAVEGKDVKPSDTDRFDFIISTDVLEHIEPEYIDAVLDEMEKYMKVAGFFVICLGPARKHWLKDGRNAHLLVRDRKWWNERLSKRWDVKELEGRGWKQREMVVLVTKKK
jgi:cyclopropane fatty-acyl-phospholipid synthase-like methyltransferase